MAAWSYEISLRMSQLFFNINSNEMPNLFTFFGCERCNLSCSHSNGDLFTYVKISCFRAKVRVVFHWCLYNKESY